VHKHTTERESKQSPPWGWAGGKGKEKSAPERKAQRKKICPKKQKKSVSRGEPKGGTEQVLDKSRRGKEKFRGEFNREPGTTNNAKGLGLEGDQLSLGAKTPKRQKDTINQRAGKRNLFREE